MIEGKHGIFTHSDEPPEFDFPADCQRPIHPLNDIQAVLEAMQHEEGYETWNGRPRLRPDFRLPMDGISDVED